jgi:hypothetical protein
MNGEEATGGWRLATGGSSFDVARDDPERSRRARLAIQGFKD